MSAWLPGCVRCCHRDVLYSPLIQDTEVCCATGEQGGAGATSARALGGCGRDVDPTRSPPMGLWGSLTYGSPQLVHRHTHSTLHLTHTTPHPLARSLYVSSRMASANLCRLLVSTHRKLAGLCGIGRKCTSLSIWYHPRESKQEAVRTQPAFAG